MLFAVFLGTKKCTKLNDLFTKIKSIISPKIAELHYGNYEPHYGNQVLDPATFVDSSRVAGDGQVVPVLRYQDGGISTS